MILQPVGVRWTIGDPDPRGFEALRLSIWGAWKLFGAAAQYAVCVNQISHQEARRRTGKIPDAVEWRPSGDLPGSLARHLDQGMAEGVAWKFAPLRLFPNSYELSLDNDCILWDLPPSVQTWLAEPEPRCLIAADIELAHGAFSHMTRAEPRNTGIRGLPPGFDLGAALDSVMRDNPVLLTSELDEQGLQVVALDRPRPAHVVPTDDVALCSPFHPKRPKLGRCGAHFIGLNVRHLPWEYYGRPASQWIAENWKRHRPTLYQHVGLAEIEAI